MQDWNLNAQRIIDYVERNLRGDITLDGVAKRLGYSPWWCTRQFSRVCGMSLRTYIRARRLSEAAMALRDSHRGILDVAVEFGFSSQEAFTRAFVSQWGLAPGAWRSSGKAFALTLPARPWSPGFRKGEMTMSLTAKRTITVSVQNVPARRFLGLWAEGAEEYFDFWDKIAERGFDCATVEGTLASLTANMQVGGWQHRNGRSGYLYGVEVPVDYSGCVPDGMELKDVPASRYAVFHHPAYDFDTEDAEVWLALKDAVAAWKPADDMEIDDEAIIWQRHDAANMGQSWCVPIRKKGGVK
jgi:AraC family transcriptional regulator